MGSVAIAWGGWEAALIASGKAQGITPSFLPATLPLLVSGTLYIDRFAAVFCVMLAAALLIALLRGGKGAWASVGASVVVLGILAASTPLTLVAWLLIAAWVVVRGVPQKQRLSFLFGMGAMVLSTLLLSGGAFLADMTVVATVSSQLPENMVFMALVLLFGGALWSVRELTGMYLLIPTYVVLRFCLFFLGSASAPLLTVVALAALIAALFTARRVGPQAYVRAAFFVLLASVPLTMMSVQLELITAVQCFLFGGLAVGAAGLLGEAGGVCMRKEGSLVMRFLLSPLPGTLLGSGLVLLGAGLWVMGESAGSLGERVYLAMLGIALLKIAFLFARLVMKKEVRRGEGVQLSGPVQMVLLAAGAVGLAQMLALLGTTIGGETPDWIIDIALKNVTLSVMPAMLTAISAVLIALVYVAKEKKPELWQKGATRVMRAYAYGDATMEKVTARAHALCTGVHTQYTRWVKWLEEKDARMEHAPLKEAAIVLIACVVVTLIVLF